MLEKFEDTDVSSNDPGDTDLFLVDRLSFMLAVCSVKSAELLLEGIVDGAVITALLGNNSKLFLEEIVGGAGSDPSELFLAFCLLERLGFSPADCSVMSAPPSALLGKPSLVASLLCVTLCFGISVIVSPVISGWRNLL